MTEEEVALVQESWAQVAPNADTAMAIFYEHLFKLDSRVAALFVATDMKAQRSNLSDALGLVVNTLSNPTLLSETLQNLGARHADYGVVEGDFAIVEKALLSTLKAGLPNLWSDELNNAWAAAWAFISEHVLTGFRSRQAA